jgi:gentisate 1,2-dioxygenase
MHWLLFAIALDLAAVQQPQVESAQAQAQPATDTRVRFEQSLTLRTAEAAAQPVQVSLRDWVIENRQTATLPARGMLVVHVRAGGRIVITIGGTRAEHKDDDFFVVPAGSGLSVQTGDDTCVLTILEVQR